MIDKIVKNNDFEKSGAETEKYGSIEELKFPQEHETVGLIILDDLKKKKHERSTTSSYV